MTLALHVTNLLCKTQYPSVCLEKSLEAFNFPILYSRTLNATCLMIFLRDKDTDFFLSKASISAKTVLFFIVPLSIF